MNNPRVARRSAAAGLLHHFCGKIGLFLLDAFANFETDKISDLGALRLEQRTNGLVRILDERLPDQRDLGQVLVQTADNHFLDDLGRLAGILGLRPENVLFLLEHIGRDGVGIDERRIQSGHVHGDVARKLFVAAFQTHQDADAAAVDVAPDHAAVGIDPLDTADLDILTELGDQLLATRLDAVAGFEIRLRKRCHVVVACGQRQFGHAIGERAEIVVFCDEIGFAVDFDQDCAVCACGLDDRAFGGNAAGLLVGLGQPALAQVFDCGFDVASGFNQGLLAFHHAGAGALAQFLDLGCGDAHDSSLSSDFVAAAFLAGLVSESGVVSAGAASAVSGDSAAALAASSVSAARSAVSASALAGPSAVPSGAASVLSAASSAVLAAAFLAVFFATFFATFLATFLLAFFLAVFFAAAAASPSLVSIGLPSASSSMNSSLSPATCGTDALPSRIASAASWA